MISELKPCPFCGEKAELYKGVTKHGLRYVFCPSCYATAGDNNESDEQAVEAWNTRAERTCRNFGGEEGTNGEDYDFACGSCGFMCDGLTNPNYCPKCRAKVVE